MGSPRGNGGMGFVSGESLRTCVQKVGTHVRSNLTKFLLYRGVFLDDRMIYSSRFTVT